MQEMQDHGAFPVEAWYNYFVWQVHEVQCLARIE